MLVCAAMAGQLLEGCGSSTKTVSVAGTPSTAQGTYTATAPVVSATETATSTSTSGPAGTGGAAAPETHTAPEPAFTEEQTTTGGLGGAEAVLSKHGYTAADPGEYHENQALSVLVGSRTGDQEQAFFFLNGRYIGTDTKEPSGDIQVLSQSDSEVTLGYGLYKPGNAMCCPAGGVAKVTFQLNNGQLTTLNPLPPVTSSTGPSRQ